MMLWSRSKVLSALVLAMAGLYQFSPLKHACLAQCRSPVRFLTEYWRPGRLGSFILGVRHGAYCVGCCWMLMALLFVGGVMNLVWIAVLTAVVLMEKLLSAGEKIGRFSGGLLLIWAIATMLV
jgi:predicted metal-binding membrane protein